MKAMWVSAFVAAIGIVVGSVLAAEVSVSDVHLCCAACTKAVGKALKGVAGVSGAKCDTDARTVTFTAANEHAVTAAIKALNAAGFHGSAKADGKDASVPDDSGAKAGDKPEEVTLTGIHNCCGMCKKAIIKTVEGVSGAGSVEIRRREVSITGNKADVAEIVKALNAAGFHVKVAK